MNIPPGLGVVVTGGAGDIGSAIARELLGHGSDVTLLDQHPSSDVTDLLADLSGLGTVTYRQVDVRNAAAVSQMIDHVEPLDIVIGNAGIVQPAPFLQITTEQWQHHLDVNLTGCFAAGQAAAKTMVRRRRAGRIIFTSSWVQDVPWPEITAYSVSKAGLKMLTRCMAAELADHRILVNAIAPGIVSAGMARYQMETDPDYAARVAHAVPLGQLQSPQQVARGVAVLCSEATDYMTGSVLLTDGGCSLRTA